MRQTETDDKIQEKQAILIVDDSEMNREILITMLEDDFDIIVAENGRVCLELLMQYGKAISAVLLDIVMPVMDGFEVLTYMNRKRWIEDIPVIMISSEESDACIRRAFRWRRREGGSCRSCWRSWNGIGGRACLWRARGI